jgi:hypothetical protein
MSKEQFMEMAQKISYTDIIKLDNIAADLPEDKACELFTNIAKECARAGTIQLKVDGVI